MLPLFTPQGQAGDSIRGPPGPPGPPGPVGPAGAAGQGYDGSGESVSTEITILGILITTFACQITTTIESYSQTDFPYYYYSRPLAAPVWTNNNTNNRGNSQR